MAEVGFFAEFMSWIKRLPVWSIPKTAGTLNVLTADKIKDAVDQLNTYTVGKDAFYGVIHPYAAYDLLADDFSVNALSHLSLQDLASVYYDKKAIDNLKSNMTFSEVCKEIEASVIRTKGREIAIYQPPLSSPLQRRIEHSDEERLSYTKDENYKTRRVVYNKETNKIDLLPTSSLAFNT
jgi:hypothetical protein